MLMSVPLPRLVVFVTIAIPLLISVFTTVTDEMAESGAERFRALLTFQRVCVNVQWSLAAFYFGISRSALYPNSSADIREISSTLMIASLILGLLGTVFIRRASWLAYTFAGLSLLVVLGIGTRL